LSIVNYQLDCVMVKKFLLEAVVDSLDAALAAEAAGADRLELCSALELGGLTPGPGLVHLVCSHVSIPVHVLIRTRSGDFTCTAHEFETLRLEAEMARNCGAAGVVAGILLENGRIDVERMRLLVKAASPAPVTFHRAFDRLADRNDALADLMATGCLRLLSSGMEANAELGAANLQWLRKSSHGWLVVMPGGGVSPENVAQIAAETGAVEFHFSAIRQDAQGKWLPNPEKVRAIKAALETYFATPQH
jgi:copper homeostasis protein